MKAWKNPFCRSLEPQNLELPRPQPVPDSHDKPYCKPQGGVTISIKPNTVATVHCSPRNPPWIRKPLLQGPLAGKRQNVFALEHLQLLVPGNGPYLKKLLIRWSKDVRGSKDMSFRVFQSVGFPWVPLKTRNGACWPFSLLGSAWDARLWTSSRNSNQSRVQSTSANILNICSFTYAIHIYIYI